jgi:hypothetical protein
VAASAEAHRKNLVAARQHAAEILKRQPGYWVGTEFDGEKPAFAG